MSIKKTLLGTLAYAAVTFPVAVLWHVGLFESAYRRFGYLEGEPSFVLGLASMIVQGFVLSALYPRVAFAGGRVERGLKYAAVMGVFYWTCHVLAFLAKQSVDAAAAFAAMESIYLSLQFGVFGALIGLIYGTPVPIADDDWGQRQLKFETRRRRD